MEHLISVTFTCKPQCHHRTGWYKSVVFKLWIFEVKRKFFLCTDCQDLIPYEEALDIWQNFKKEEEQKC